MSLLWKVISAGLARSTHHKLALDALQHLEHSSADRWRDVILSHHAAYLEGAKAPDDDFRDFKNHVLHVRENFWGGAISAATNWYGTLVDHLRGREWKDAAYSAGVLSHYITDPLMPFHTGQTESEGAVHRAAEWSVTKSYDTLRSLIPSVGGYPRVVPDVVGDWLSKLLRDGATFANQFYDLLVDHYDLATGIKDPPAGLDDTARNAIARCLAQATIRFARVFDRALDEADVLPPDVTLSLASVLATVNVPLKKITGKLDDSKDRAEVEAIWQEVQTTGKAIESLPDSERLVRQFHAKEVLKVPLATLDAERPRTAGTRHSAVVAQREQASRQIVEKSAIAESAIASPKVIAPRSVPIAEPATMKPAADRSPRFFLHRNGPIVDAPSIGPKMAARLEAIGITTVADLLSCDPGTVAESLRMNKHGTNVLREWQAQSQLMLTVPGLRGHDAQLLVAVDVRDQPTLAAQSVESLLARVSGVASSTEGRRILRDSAAPDLDEVHLWITAAQSASPSLKAG